MGQGQLSPTHPNPKGLEELGVTPKLLLAIRTTNKPRGVTRAVAAGVISLSRFGAGKYLFL